jgi:hypothetical protein
MTEGLYFHAQDTFFITPESLTSTYLIPVISKTSIMFYNLLQYKCSQLPIRILATIDTELLLALSVRIEYITSTELGNKNSKI